MLVTRLRSFSPDDQENNSRESNMQSLSLLGGKHLLITKITSDKDISFSWCIAASEFEDTGRKSYTRNGH